MNTEILLTVVTISVLLLQGGTAAENQKWEVKEQGISACTLEVIFKEVVKKIEELGGIVDKMKSSDSTDQPTPGSCDEIKTRNPGSHSGFYSIRVKGKLQKVYCNMDTLCGDNRGGWTRIAYLNMADRDQRCPPGFRMYQANGVRACGKQMAGAGCQSIKFSSKSISYTQVCGRVTGYQKGSPDAFNRAFSKRDSLDHAYVDGVSITRGNPRKHVFTFVASLAERYRWCPGCDSQNKESFVPSFIGKDFFCETATLDKWDITTLHTGDPLWDGRNCGVIQSSCCKAPGIPWFNKALQQPTTDYIELRVCGDQVTRDEDSPVGAYEIYIK